MLFSWCPPLNMSLGKVPVSAFWDLGFADNHRRQGYCFMLNIDFAYASSNDNAKFHFLISSSLTLIILTAFKSKVADDGISKKREVSTKNATFWGINMNFLLNTSGWTKRQVNSLNQAPKPPIWRRKSFITATISFITFWGFSTFYQILLSPQVKRSAIITYKQAIYKLPHQFPNNLRLRILGN